MINILLTAFIIVALALASLWKVSKDPSGNFFMSKDFTSTVKGICAIVVVFVHVPEAYQNPFQDAVGSFAYVAVTFFFLFSSFGMLYSFERNPDYLNHFWRNRLLSLLIPNIIVNIGIYAIGVAVNFSEFSLTLLYSLNHYVVVLLEYCLLFYIVAALQKRFTRISPSIADAIIISAVVLSSLALYFAKAENEVSASLDWCYERFGLVWGILLYRFLKPIKRWLSSKKMMKTVVSVALSLLLGIAYLKFKNVWFLGEFMLKIVLGASLILTTFISLYGWRLDNRVTRFLGSTSYEIYLAHGYVMSLLIFCLPQLQSGVFMWSTLLATISFSVVAQIISSRIVKTFRAK